MVIPSIVGGSMHDVGYVRSIARDAHDVGHWKRLLAIYGSHHPGCDAQVRPNWDCTCGFWESLYGWPGNDTAATATGSAETP